MVIAVLAAISIVAFNGITNRAKASAMASDLTSWKKKSETHKTLNNIECPTNYVFVYGNATLGTSDFCVMKYEAKIQGNDNGQTAYSAAMVAESRPTGTPWVNITQTQAITEATETGGRLITEPEWMTIAADVLGVKYNWSGGEIGSGYIYSGHNDNSAGALAASTDDTDGYNGTGNSAATGDNQKRTLYLKSGDVIWDFPGNVWEWMQLTVGIPTLTPSQIGVSGDTGFNWRPWNFGSLSLGNLPATSRPSVLATLPGLTNVTNWSSTQGIGQVYANYADTTPRALIRGGNWNHGANAGVLSLYLNHVPSLAGTLVGFRVSR